MFPRRLCIVLCFVGCSETTPTPVTAPPFEAWSPDRVAQKQDWIRRSALREKRAHVLQDHTKHLLCAASANATVTLTPERIGPETRHNLGDLKPHRRTEKLGWLSSERLHSPQDVPIVTGALSSAFADYFSGYTAVEHCEIHTYAITETETETTIKISWHLSGTRAGQRPIEDHAKLTLRFSSDDALTELIVDEHYRVHGAKPLFREMSATVLSPPHTPDEGSRPMNVDTGGLSVHDVNADGLLDIYIAQDGPNLLYIQQPDGRFVESAEAYGIADPHNSRGVVFADFDADGLDDLVVANFEAGFFKKDGILQLYRRVAPTRFEPITAAALGGEYQQAFTHVAVTDIDGDEDLDLFVGCYGDRELDSPNHFINADNGCPNQLWMNQGQFKFKEEAKKRGLTHTDWTYAAGFVDIDGDHDQDLYLANDWGKNRFYLNNGNGVFRDIAPSNQSDHPGAGMSVLWADLDHNNTFDLYVSNMYSNAGNRILPYSELQGDTVKDALISAAAGNELYLNPTPNSATPATKPLALADGGWAWGAVAFDYDLDGDFDIYQANGYVTGKRQKDQ